MENLASVFCRFLKRNRSELQPLLFCCTLRALGESQCRCTRGQIRLYSGHETRAEK